MKTKIIVLSFIAVTILFCVSCGKKQQEFKSISNSIPISVISESEQPDKILVILDSIAKTQVDTDLSISVPYNNLSDWNKVKKVFRQWRNDEISKGYYVESCLENPEKFIEKYEDKWMTDSLRYAIPNNPEKFTTYKADINFDGKQDVIFKIFPIDCIEGNGLAAPTPIYVTLLSKEGSYIVDNTFIYKVEKSIKNFSKTLSNNEYQWILIDDIKSERGIVVISGNSHIYLDDDASCCPSIVFDFTGYIDKTMKGYIQITGVYKNQFEETEDKFNLKLKVE